MRTDIDPERHGVPLTLAPATFVPCELLTEDGGAALEAVHDWLVAELASGALVLYGRQDRVAGKLLKVNADAWRGKVYVHGSRPGLRSNGRLNFEKGTAFFWSEGTELYDVRIARACSIASGEKDGAAGTNAERHERGRDRGAPRMYKSEPAVRGFLESVRSKLGQDAFTRLGVSDLERQIRQRLAKHSLPQRTRLREWIRDFRERSADPAPSIRATAVSKPAQLKKNPSR